MKTINIKTINIGSGELQSRAAINNEIVTEYAEAIKAGAEFPAVVVFNDGAENWLADGFHRFHAHNQAGKTSILADVRQGTNRNAILYSLGANGTHGLHRTNADKRKAVTTMLNDFEWAAWSSNAIAKACGVSHTFVDSLRASPAILQPLQDKAPTTRTVERNGKTYEQNTANIGKAAVADSAAPTKPVPVAANASHITATPLALVEEYTELDAAHDQIHELQAELVVARIHSTDSEEAAQAATLIAELRAHIKTLEATLKAVKISRDTYQNQVAEMQRQINRQRREIDRALGTKTA